MSYIDALNEWLQKEGVSPRPGLVFDRNKHRWVRPESAKEPKQEASGGRFEGKKEDKDYKAKYSDSGAIEFTGSIGKKDRKGSELSTSDRVRIDDEGEMKTGTVESFYQSPDSKSVSTVIKLKDGSRRYLRTTSTITKE